MADPYFGAVRADVLNLLPRTVAADFDASGDGSVPVGEAEMDKELGRQERAIRVRMDADLVAKVNAKTGKIAELADLCATCAAARLGLRNEGNGDGNPPLHIANLASDCDAGLKAIEAGRFNPAGLGPNEPPAEPGFRCIPCDRG